MIASMVVFACPSLLWHPSLLRSRPLIWTPRQLACTAQAAGEHSAACPSHPEAASPGCDTSASGWHPLCSPLLWQEGLEDGALQGSPPPGLTPPWKMLLLSDGSVTRHLQLMADQGVHVECLEMAKVGADRGGLPPGTALLPGPLVQRQVLLRMPDPQGPAYVYAASWWNADSVDDYLRDKSVPIWVSLSRGRTELFREILEVQHGHSPYLESQFGQEGPFWGRSYVFWHDGRPLTIIYEVFSPRLQDYLGPWQTEIQT